MNYKTMRIEGACNRIRRVFTEERILLYLLEHTTDRTKCHISLRDLSNAISACM